MGIFQNIFKKKEQLVPFPFSHLGNDLHSHLIPGIDDGVKTIEDSILMAKGLSDLGYKNIVTTPHIMSDYYRNTPEIIRSGLANVRNAYKEHNIDINIEAAAEYYVDYDFTSKIEKEELLTFGKKYILIECSFIEPPKGLTDAIFQLQTNGYKPILAHPERYMYWHKDTSLLKDLKDRDVYFQVNILSLTGHYSHEVATMAEWLLENRMVEWLGSDLHNAIQLDKLKHIQIKESVWNNIQKTAFLNQSL